MNKTTLRLDEEENKKAQRILAKRGFTTIKLEDITNDPVRYSKILADGKKNNEHGHLVWGHTPEELSDGRMLLATKDNGVCISIRENGEICSFVRNPKIKPHRKGVILTAMATVLAVKIPHGTIHTECYSEETARKYEKLGFKVVGYYGWWKDDQPADWPDWDDTKPNMYFLIHNGDSASAVAEKYGTYNTSTDEQLRALPYFGVKQCPEIYEYAELLCANRMDEAYAIYEKKRKELNS